MLAHFICRRFNSVFVVFLFLTGSLLGCGPGPPHQKRRSRNNNTPLVYKQHVPNTSEDTLGASGVSEGKIDRDDEDFKNLVTNNDANIIFKDEEGDGSDRIMTKGCKDKLRQLAIKVMNFWPGVKLRVTEAWDNDGHHAEDSLHYEGRAVDITTSDRDRSKYGMLARLAVQAGFDWVYYESRGHIHCSVKSDNSITVKLGGCFPGTSAVFSATGGKKTLSEISVGEQVLSMSPTGSIEFSEVIAFLDKNPGSREIFYTILTADRHQISLTAKHLIYISEGNNTSTIDVTSLRAVFAEEVKVGQYVYFADDYRTAKPSQVIDIKSVVEHGFYAPLTKHGTIVVDGVVASCYSHINNVHLAHLAFMPMRVLHDISRYISLLSWTENSSIKEPDSDDVGVHWYAELLINIGKTLLSRTTLTVP